VRQCVGGFFYAPKDPLEDWGAQPVAAFPPPAGPSPCHAPSCPRLPSEETIHKYQYFDLRIPDAGALAWQI
jgi:hypothetical protein